MKNVLIAAAVAAVFAAPAAFADTTLYGIGHVSLDFAEADGTADRGVVLASNSSRIGVKGSHKISDTLAAVYKMEWAVNVDGAGSDMGQRNRYVGLKGGFGTVVFGRHDTPMKAIANKYELGMGGTQLGSATGLLGAGGFHARADNVVGYINSFGPVNVFAAYVTSLGADTAENDDSAMSVSATLGNGKPYSVSVAYESHNGDAAGFAEDPAAARIGASYQLGAVKLVGQYTAETDTAGAAGSDRDTYGVGAALKMGKNTLKAEFFAADPEGDNNDSELVAVGLDHKLSKLATTYINYGIMTNDSGASLGLGGAGHGQGAEAFTPTAGGDASGFSLGLIVKF